MIAEIRDYPPMRQRERAVQYTRPDERIFVRTLQAMPAVAEVVEAVASDGEPGEGTAWKRHESKLDRAAVAGHLFDTFSDFSKSRPRDNEECESPLAVEMVRRMREHPDYHDIKSYTAGDDHASALASASVCYEVITNLPEEVEQSEADRHEQQQQADDAAEQAEHAQQRADETEQDDSATDEQKSQARAAAEQAQQQAAQAAQSAQAATQRCRSAIERNGRAIATAVSQGMEKGGENAKAIASAAQFFGTENSSVSGGLPLDQKMQLAETLMRGGEKLRRAIDMVGRATATAKRKQAEKIRGESGEIVDIAEGDDLSRVLPSELALLDEPGELGLLAQMRMVEGKMLQHEVENRQQMQRGDIVVLLDESGSMSGTPEMEAKAVAIALANIAARQKRSVHVMFFQTTITEQITLDPRTASASRDGVAMLIRDLNRIAGRGTGGGTSYDQPLMAAMDRAMARGTKADIVMITDGCASLSNETKSRINHARKATGLSVFSMLIGRAGGSSERVVSEFSDRVWSVDSLLGKEAAELFGAI